MSTRDFNAYFMLCRIRVCGREIPGKQVVLQVLLTSCLGCEAEVTALALDPQPGFVCKQDPPELASLLPVTVPLILPSLRPASRQKQ